jgi:hypothetical protein
MRDLIRHVSDRLQNFHGLVKSANGNNNISLLNIGVFLSYGRSL